LNTVFPRRAFGFIALLSLTLSFGLATASAADDPAVVITRNYCDALLAEMKTAKATPIRKRYEQLEPAIRTMFDLPEMTRIAVGRDWDNLDAKDQQIIVEAFSRFTIATYANRFDGFSGEHFEVEPKPELRGDNKVIHTAIVKSDGSKVALNYLMMPTGNKWQAIDVYLSGTISELATRRSEFASLLRSGGPTALVEKLKAQTERQLAG
jgi:phospholipid transport system substrate-binding protein